MSEYCFRVCVSLPYSSFVDRCGFPNFRYLLSWLLRTIERTRSRRHLCLYPHQRMRSLQCLQPGHQGTRTVMNLRIKPVMSVLVKSSWCVSIHSLSRQHTDGSIKVFLTCSSIDLVALMDQTTLAASLNIVSRALGAGSQSGWIAGAYFL
jgi:hypothetical protein